MWLVECSMSIWSRITDAVQTLAKGASLADVFERLRRPDQRSVGFTIAVIALGAKMAKADGQVTRDEVTAFREVFRIDPGDERAAARVFDLARQDVTGFDTYARRVGRMFSDDQRVLEDLVEGLFHIATADGHYHPDEATFLEQVAHHMRLPDSSFRAIRARHVDGAAPDPFDVLGVEPGTPLPDIRKRWRTLVRENHPDQLTARGVPDEAVVLATKRMAAINDAWHQISSEAAN